MDGIFGKVSWGKWGNSIGEIQMSKLSNHLGQIMSHLRYAYMQIFVDFNLSYTHIYTYSLSHTHSLSLSYTHTHSLSHTHTHSLIHALSLSDFVFLPYTLTMFLIYLNL